MNPRTDPTDPANMTPEERLTEVATILAAGVLRLRRAAGRDSPGGRSHSPCRIFWNLRQMALMVRSETRLHGQRG